ncbi:MAG: NUDIX domain-containing protein [bacterium]
MNEQSNEVVVVNEKDEIIGTMPRKEAHQKAISHRISIIYVENDKGEISIQVRKTERLDHSSAGHVDPGETYEQAAYRELMEELNISGVKLTLIGKGLSDEISPTKLEHRVHFFEVFVCRSNSVEINKEELKDAYWADPQEIYKEMVKNPDDLKFTGCFRTSLPIYLKYIKK